MLTNHGGSHPSRNKYRFGKNNRNTRTVLVRFQFLRMTRPAEVFFLSLLSSVSSANKEEKPLCFIALQNRYINLATKLSFKPRGLKSGLNEM